MANNRMALVCKQCKVGISIAKFYPSEGTGWFSTARLDERLNEFFMRHSHEFDHDTLGGDQYEMKYEMEGEGPNEWQYEK